MQLKRNWWAIIRVHMFELTWNLYNNSSSCADVRMNRWRPPPPAHVLNNKWHHSRKRINVRRFGALCLSIIHTINSFSSYCVTMSYSICHIHVGIFSWSIFRQQVHTLKQYESNWDMSTGINYPVLFNVFIFPSGSTISLFQKKIQRKHPCIFLKYSHLI